MNQGKLRVIAVIVQEALTRTTWSEQSLPLGSSWVQNFTSLRGFDLQALTATTKFEYHF